jgi:hypothetical protein
MLVKTVEKTAGHASEAAHGASRRGWSNTSAMGSMTAATPLIVPDDGLTGCAVSIAALVGHQGATDAGREHCTSVVVCSLMPRSVF